MMISIESKGEAGGPKASGEGRRIEITVSFLFFFLWNQSLNSGLRKAGALPLEPNLQPEIAVDSRRVN
jgi:hypothetical protein